jgi:beta-galactosidase
VENLDDDFLVDWRDGFWVATNFTAKAQAAPVAAGSTCWSARREVPIAGVTVWQDPL